MRISTPRTAISSRTSSRRSSTRASPEATRTISAATQYQKTDYNIFEGWEMKGVNKHTVLRGRVTFQDGVLDEEGLRGYGKYIPRPTHSRFFEQARRKHATREINAVARE